METTTRSLTVTGADAGGHDCPCGCAPCAATCCRLDCLVQPRFFCGQLLTDHDLTALVGWARDKFALARHRDGWGVVCGLDVRCSSDARHPLRVAVTPGYAVSCCGDDIIVCEETVLDLSDACREEADPCADLRRQLRGTRDGGGGGRGRRTDASGTASARAYGNRPLGRAAASSATATGALEGTVRDGSGATVPNATVTVTNFVTGASRTATTNSDGRYSVPNLPPGRYRVSAGAPGFGQLGERDANVSAGENTTADIPQQGVDSGGGDEMENFRAVDIFLRYAEKPSGPSTALGRSVCKEVAECEYSRTEESYALGWQMGQLNTEPVERAARRWHEGYEKCLDVLTEFRDAFSFTQAPPNGEDVRRWLVSWMEKHPLRQFCHLRDEICQASAADLRDEARLTGWLFGFVQDCRNAYLSCDCAGCQRDTGVPLARVWLRSIDGRWGRESCRVAQVDPYPPYRRPLRPDCWPAPLGQVNVGRAIWHRWEEACTMLDDLGVRVTREAFAMPSTLAALEEALDCDLFVECGEERTAYVYDAGPLGQRVVGFCAGAAQASPQVSLTMVCQAREDGQWHDVTETWPDNEIRYVFTAHNPSSLDLSNVSLSDTLTNYRVQNAQIAAGATEVWETPNQYVRQYDDGSGNLHNEATVTGYSSDGQTATDTATNDLRIINPVIVAPSLTLAKGGPATGRPLQEVLYNYTVTNTGQSPLTVDITDDRAGSVTTGHPLQPGQSANFERLYVIPRAERGQLTNVATATGRTAEGQIVMVTDTHTLIITTGQEAARDTPAPAERTAAAGRDDFTAIRGIGEARAAALNEAGINTYGQLAATPIERLQELFNTITEEVLKQWVADAQRLARA